MFTVQFLILRTLVKILKPSFLPFHTKIIYPSKKINLGLITSLKLGVSELDSTNVGVKPTILTANISVANLEISSNAKSNWPNKVIT